MTTLDLLARAAAIFLAWLAFDIFVILALFGRSLTQAHQNRSQSQSERLGEGVGDSIFIHHGGSNTAETE